MPRLSTIDKHDVSRAPNIRAIECLDAILEGASTSRPFELLTQLELTPHEQYARRWP